MRRIRDIADLDQLSFFGLLDAQAVGDLAGRGLETCWRIESGGDEFVIRREVQVLGYPLCEAAAFEQANLRRDEVPRIGLGRAFLGLFIHDLDARGVHFKDDPGAVQRGGEQGLDDAAGYAQRDRAEHQPAPFCHNPDERGKVQVRAGPGTCLLDTRCRNGTRLTGSQPVRGGARPRDFITHENLS